MLEKDSPAVYNQFLALCATLEKHYRDMQDIEFTIQNQKLYILQTRTGKRNAQAAVQVAVDMVEEGLITHEEALMRVEPASLEQILHRRIDHSTAFTVLATGLPASPGAASGKIVFDADTAYERGHTGEKVILVRTETTPDDIHGIVVAQGILTSRGGMTSHAAVVARGMGKCCVCGCEALNVDVSAKTMSVSDIILKENDIITLDGGTGQVIIGEVSLIDPVPSPSFITFLEWADEYRRLGVYANADTPEDAAKAREMGATGIGLCRTEHMFMEQNRLPIVQQMILSVNKEQRVAALDQLLPFQEEDFYGILKAMDGLEVTIRLLDPPLHEFLPDQESLVVEITTLKLTNGDAVKIHELENLLHNVRALHEANPMLGTRGCRLGVLYPEIYQMQARAIFKATARLLKENLDPKPQVEIPLVIDRKELTILREAIEIEAKAVAAASGVSLECLVGVMLELPRACLMAGELAEEADFMTFGTNDLTQTTLGFSRDDAEGKFLTRYVDQKILEENPFIVLDVAAVGELMEIAITRGRAAKPGFTFGICGEHGGDPTSVQFCHKAGLDFVSCSPFRVPIARLAAAQAAISQK